MRRIRLSSSKCQIQGPVFQQKNNKEMLDHFYQIENSYIESDLGFSMVQQLVESYHGKAMLHSEIRKWSTFFIHFPRDKSSHSRDEFLNDNVEGKQDIMPPIYSDRICVNDEHEPTNTQVIEKRNYSNSRKQ